MFPKAREVHNQSTELRANARTLATPLDANAATARLTRLNAGCKSRSGGLPVVCEPYARRNSFPNA